MRSSKSRSRSKSNRPRSMGNIVNRVFDSSGPEGKVRGTPQQIIEKYQILARDAQLSNDRVAAENFLQHAEHYTRMLAEAQRELAVEQEQRRPQGDYGNSNGQHVQVGYQGGPPSPQRDQQGRDPSRDRPYREDRTGLRDESPEGIVPRSTGLMDFIDDLGDSGLVETPETRHRPVPPRNPPQERRERAPRPEGGVPEEDRNRPREGHPQDAQPVAAPEAAPEAAQPSRKPRAPRKPRAAAKSPDGDGPAEAAE